MRRRRHQRFGQRRRARGLALTVGNWGRRLPKHRTRVLLMVVGLWSLFALVGMLLANLLSARCKDDRQRLAHQPGRPPCDPPVRIDTTLRHQAMES